MNPPKQDVDGPNKRGGTTKQKNHDEFTPRGKPSWFNSKYKYKNNSTAFF
ncbi:MAG: hypothetical protein VB084_10745 [Syntrophomonadaceae bacterium]|nr:hypothetical protein [Syntrophomonadaceae bacterium]